MENSIGFVDPSQNHDAEMGKEPCAKPPLPTPKSQNCLFHFDQKLEMKNSSLEKREASLEKYQKEPTSFINEPNSFINEAELVTKNPAPFENEGESIAQLAEEKEGVSLDVLLLNFVNLNKREKEEKARSPEKIDLNQEIDVYIQNKYGIYMNDINNEDEKNPEISEIDAPKKEKSIEASFKEEKIEGNSRSTEKGGAKFRRDGKEMKKTQEKLRNGESIAKRSISQGKQHKTKAKEEPKQDHLLAKNQNEKSPGPIKTETTRVKSEKALDSGVPLAQHQFKVKRNDSFEIDFDSRKHVPLKNSKKPGRDSSIKLINGLQREKTKKKDSQTWGIIGQSESVEINEAEKLKYLRNKKEQSISKKNDYEKIKRKLSQEKHVNGSKRNTSESKRNLNERKNGEVRSEQIKGKAMLKPRNGSRNSIGQAEEKKRGKVTVPVPSGRQPRKEEEKRGNEEKLKDQKSEKVSFLDEKTPRISIYHQKARQENKEKHERQKSLPPFFLKLENFVIPEEKSPVKKPKEKKPENEKSTF